MKDFIVIQKDTTFARSAVVKIERNGSVFTIHLNGLSEPIKRQLGPEDAKKLEPFFEEPGNWNDYMEGVIQS